MAVPFAMPDDSEDAILEQNILAGIYALLRLLQEMNARRARTPRITTAINTTSGSDSRRRNEQLRETLSTLLDLSTSNVRTEAEAACCDDSKDIIVSSSGAEVGEEWRHQMEEIENCQDEERSATSGRFSKLVPNFLSGSIWTAVICAVGWRLLKMR